MMMELLVVVLVMVTGSAMARVGSYQMDIVIVDSMDPKYAAQVHQSAERWQSVVIGTHSNRSAVAPAGMELCYGESATIVKHTTTWPDLRVYVKIHPIDGPGKILGQAYICSVDNAVPYSMPRVGWIELDSADVAMMYKAGVLKSAIIHEMGHLLGIGSTWNAHKLENSHYQYTGKGGIEGNAAIGFKGYPMIENLGGVGTANVHWSEKQYGSELMTGWLSGPSQPLTALTGDSLLDLGFIVDPTKFDAPTNMERAPRKNRNLRGQHRMQYHTGTEKTHPPPNVLETTENPT